MKNKPIVVNLFASPGSGKSTGASYIFSQLKMRGVNVELITEFAKDLTWENNSCALSCQEYVLGNQSYRLHRCRDKVDVIITDSPIFLSILFKQEEYLDEHFDLTVMSVMNSYNNVNYFIERDKPYNPIGRNETEIESNILKDKLVNLLNKYDVKFTTVKGNIDGYDLIVEDICKMIE